MDTALFAYHDPAAAERALQRLAEAGLPGGAAKLHRHPAPRESQTLTQIDEQATGGFVRNAQHLLQQVFAWAESPSDPERYAATLDKGGAVLAVEARPDVDRAAIERVLRDSGYDERTDWLRSPPSAPS